MKERADAELVRDCLAGDESAWEALVREYGGLVYAVAGRAGLEEDDRADVFQAVFVIAFRNLHLLDRPEALGGWLATIARRESWRTKRRRTRESGTEIDEQTASDRAGVEEEMARAEQAHLVQRGLRRLDDRCRRLLEMLFFRDPAPSYEEVAGELDIPIGSLGPTRGRCMDKLRRILGELGF
jgi:RNA polymerase sigma factor (sigma-70 family)